MAGAVMPLRKQLMAQTATWSQGKEMDWRMDVRFIAGVFFMFIHVFSPGNLFYIIIQKFIYNYLRRRTFCSEVPNK